ncbi:MAG: EAL domain-containing protein [Desulfobacterales bacterium]|nr:EAL domain-containing protein [Desulfobacterales bacterium]
MTIRNKMLFWFMTMGLIPVICVALIAMMINRQALSDRTFSQLVNVREVKTEQIKSYMQERQTDLAILMDTVDGLRQAAFNKLQTVQENKKAQILKHFHKIAKDIDVISKSIVVSRALKDFRSVVDDRGQFDTLLYDFFETEKYGDTLVKFRDTYGYYDLLLVTADGTVVYSARKDRELGENLKTGPLVDTSLSQCFRTGLSTLNFKDFSRCPDENGRYLAFFGSPVKAKDNTLLGVVILKINTTDINEITLRRQGMGDTGETYLSVIQDGRPVLRSRRPLTGDKVGDIVRDSLADRQLFSAVKPQIRIREAGGSEIAIYEPVPIFGETFILSTRMSLNEVIDPRRQEQAMDYFSKFIQAYGYKNLYLVSPGGQIFYTAVAEEGETGLTIIPDSGLARLHGKIMASKGPAFTDFSRTSQDPIPYAYIGAPLMYRGRVEMVAALKLPVDDLNSIMQVKRGLGKTTDIYLVGPDKLLRSDSFLMPETFSVARSFLNPGVIRVETLPVRRALGGETGQVTARDYRDIEVLSAYGPIDFMGTTWAVLAELDKEEAFAPLTFFAVLVGVGTILTAGLISMFSLYAAKRLSAPVLALKAAAERVKNKDYNLHVSVDTRDELKLLAEAFNDMTRTVKVRSNALEQKIHQLENAQAEVRQSEERFRGLVESTSDWIWEVDQDAVYTYASPRITQILGYQPEEIIGKTPFDLMPEGERERIANTFGAIVDAGIPFSSLENTNIHRDGHPVSLETSGVPFFGEDGELLGYRGIDRDISKRKRNEEALLMTESVFTNTIEGIAITNRDGKIQRVNQAFCDITGYTREEAVGQNPRILKSDRHDMVFYKEMWDNLLSKGQWSGEIWNRRKDGSAYPEWLSISAIRNDRGEITNFVSLFHDISEEKLKEEQLQFLAFHDPLTKLPNRKLLYDRAEVSLRNARRFNQKMALLYMDLDDFKNINDSYGHPFGDEFLIQVKDRISTVCRESDTFARYGGDEFVIVLNNIHNEGEVIEFSNRILELFKSPVTIMGEEVYTSVSIGLAIFPDDGDDLITLEKHADMALYEAKRDGKRRSFHFKQALKDKMLRKIQLENRLRQSVGPEKFRNFTVVYQPKVNTAKENQIHSVEALLRWGIDGEPVSPGEFIPIAEDTNLIIPIGEWLMKRAMADIRAIQKAGCPDISLSINLSTKQFNDDNLLSIISKTIQSTDFQPERLCFEITESIPMEDADRAIRIMERLSAMGVQLSMDDFGTGYSSLSVLKRFPLNELKIDRSFVRELPENPNDAAICKTIIHMAETLGFNVIAEGVETDEQLNFFRENKCRLIQGFLFHKPMEAAALSTILNEC